MANSPFAEPNRTDISAELAQVKGSVESTRGSVEKITVLRESGGRVSWSPDGKLILFDQKGADGYFDLYLMRPDGTEEECLTCESGGVLSKGHKGTGEWHPSGKYIVFQSEKKLKRPSWGKDLAAQPGFGRYSDVWLMEVGDKRFTQLTKTADTDDTGVLHPHFSKDGTRLVWSQMYEKPSSKKAAQAGYWKLKVADFLTVSKEPVLSNIMTYEPGTQGLYESHGFSPDGTKLLFTGWFESKGALDFFKAANVYTYDLTSKTLEKLAYEKYNEHALYSPNGKRILWMTSADNQNNGTDYWSMDPDGKSKRRITDFNNPKLKSFKGKAITSADSSLSPDGKRLVAYLQINLATQAGMIVVIDFKTDL